MSIPSTTIVHPIANPEATITANKARFTILTDRLIRLGYSAGDRFEDRPSQAFYNTHG